MKIIIKD